MSTNLLDEMRAEGARIEEDSLYSGKGHFEAARAWGNVHLWVGIPTAVLAAVASASAFKQQVAAAGALALTASVLSAISTFLNASERAQLHHRAGVKHNALRNRARIFRELDLKTETGSSDLLASLKALAKEREDLNLSSPQIPKWAFRLARAGIEAGEAAYKIDSETTGARGGKSGGA